jgi:hypothetical protein
MSDELADTLKRIDRNIAALLAINVDRHLRESDLAKPRPRSIDRMLSDVGLTDSEIGILLGKTRQAVGQVLAKDAKSAKPPRSRSQFDGE